MKAWIVKRDYALWTEEGWGLIGVFSSLEKAEAVAQTLNSEPYPDGAGGPRIVEILMDTEYELYDAQSESPKERVR